MTVVAASESDPLVFNESPQASDDEAAFWAELHDPVAFPSLERRESPTD
jgi:hypothetical protein